MSEQCRVCDNLWVRYVDSDERFHVCFDYYKGQYPHDCKGGVD